MNSSLSNYSSSTNNTINSNNKKRTNRNKERMSQSPNIDNHYVKAHDELDDDIKKIWKCDIFNNDFFKKALQQFIMKSNIQIEYNYKSIIGGGSYSKIFLGSLNEKKYAIKFLFHGKNKILKELSVKEAKFILNNFNKNLIDAKGVFEFDNFMAVVIILYFNFSDLLSLRK